jgi:hypothetical protein
VDTQKLHKKVYFEKWTRDGYKGRWIYSQRHMRFSEADIPALFEKRPYKHMEKRKPDYLYRIDKDGIHIALFYDGLPIKE